MSEENHTEVKNETNNYQEIQENLMERAEEIKKKACEIEEQVSSNINELMGVTAEKLDKAADKMHNTAEFFRNNNVSKVKEDMSSVIRQNPGKSLLGGILLGFIFGKIFFK